jgi:hypothetical protein
VRVFWADPRCIVCLSTPVDDRPMTARTDGHVIPSSVGGELSALNLCKRCNSEMGRMEALLAKDVSIRRHVKYHLQSRLPEKLVGSILKGEEYFLDHDEFGRVVAVVDELGDLNPKASAGIKSDEDTLAQALAELDRIEAPEERKAELRTDFERAELDSWIEVRPGYRIHRLIDWSDIKFRESLTDRPVNHEVPLGIAYLYLAICLGERVYDDALAPVRAALVKAIDGDPADARALLPPDRRMGVDSVEPIHLLRAKNADEGVQVTLQVFRAQVWPVDFRGVHIGGEQTLYTIDMESGEERWCSKVPG